MGLWVPRFAVPCKAILRLWAWRSEVSDLLQQGRLQCALKAFAKNPDGADAASLLTALSRSGDSHGALEVYRQLKMAETDRGVVVPRLGVLKGFLGCMLALPRAPPPPQPHHHNHNHHHQQHHASRSRAKVPEEVWWCRMAWNDMEALGAGADVVALGNLAALCAREADPTTARRILDFLASGAYLAFQPDAATWIHVLSTLNAYPALLPPTGRGIKEAVERRSGAGALARADLWAELMVAHVQRGELNLALRLLGEMRARKVRPTSQTYASLLNGCALHRDVATGQALHRELEAQPEMLCDLPLANSLVAMYARCGRLDAAMGVLGAMRASGKCVPSTATYAALVRGCAASRDLDLGRSLHHQFQDQKPALRMSTALGNALVAMYTRCGRLEPALGVLGQMDEAGAPADGATFTSLLHCCAQHKALQQGRALHHRVVRSEIPIVTALGTALINMYCQCGELNHAMSTLHTMDHSGVRPDRSTFASLFLGCAIAHSPEAGKALHYRMLQSRIPPDAVVYGALIHMYCQCKHLERGVALLNDMEAEGLAPSADTFAAVIAGCALKRELGVGREVHLRLVASRSEISTHVGNSLIHMYCECDDLDNAVGVVEDMERASSEAGRPTNTSYALVARACARLRRLDVGRALHKRLLARGAPVDVVLGTTLVHMYGVCGDTGSAMRVLRSAGVRVD